jgi:head-tail adaptor
MTSQLSTAEIAQMRTDLETLLPDTCVISTVSYASDGAGEWVPTWTAAGTVNCRLDPVVRGFEEIVSGGAIQPFRHYMLTLPYDAPITSASRVRVGGIDYNVVGLSANNSWALDTRAKLEKV